MKHFTYILLLVFLLPVNAFSQIGYYLKVNGTDWTQNTIVTNKDKLIFGMKEGTNLTPCYNLSVSTVSLNNAVLFSPTGIKNPWNIDLATVMNGKTGVIKLEIKGKGCTTNAEQWWIVNISVSAAPANSTTSTSTNNSTTTGSTTTGKTIKPGKTDLSIIKSTDKNPMVKPSGIGDKVAQLSGTTDIASINQVSPRTQHVVAQVVFTNKTARVDKVSFVTGYPVTNNYQAVTNLNTGGGVVKTTPTGSKYLEYSFTNVPTGGRIVAKYEYDITTYDITMNLSKVSSKPYKSNTDYTNFTRSVPNQCDLNHSRLKTICDDLWSKSNNNYMTYAQKVAEWMSTNTEWKFTGGILPLNDFLNNPVNGKCYGDCGSLSNAFCAMLRYKGIPARLLVGYGTERMTEQDAKYHAWLEFYIQDFGWIPVDPSYRMNNRIELGKIIHKGIIVSYDAYYDLTINGGVFKDMFIQSYLWAVNGNVPNGSYDLKFTAVSSNFSE